MIFKRIRYGISPIAFVYSNKTIWPNFVMKKKKIVFFYNTFRSVKNILFVLPSCALRYCVISRLSASWSPTVGVNRHCRCKRRFSFYFLVRFPFLFIYMDKYFTAFTCDTEKQSRIFLRRPRDENNPWRYTGMWSHAFPHLI